MKIKLAIQNNLLPILLLVILFMPGDIFAQSVADVISQGNDATDGLIGMMKKIFTLVIIIGAVYIGYAFFSQNPKAREMVIGFIVVLIIYAIVMTYI